MKQATYKQVAKQVAKAIKSKGGWCIVRNAKTTNSIYIKFVVDGEWITEVRFSDHEGTRATDYDASNASFDQVMTWVSDQGKIMTTDEIVMPENIWLMKQI